MADAQNSSGGGFGGTLAAFVLVASLMARIVTAPLRWVVDERHLGAFFRQGVHELGNTFGQMSPDSNTSREVGNIWSPTASEISKPAPIRPSQIAGINSTYRPGPADGQGQRLGY